MAFRFTTSAGSSLSDFPPQSRQPGAFLKIPGPKPTETVPALNWYTLEELERLRRRLDTALKQATQRCVIMSDAVPGNVVRLARDWQGVDAGRIGIVVQNDATNQAHENYNRIPVAFHLAGIVYTPITMLDPVLELGRAVVE